MSKLDPRLPKDMLERVQFLRDPLQFIIHCMHTFDPADQRVPVKRMNLDELPYIESVVRAFQAQTPEDPLLIIDKSRRMRISWTMCALHLHYAFTNIERHVGMFSKKQEDADELLGRCKFIYDNIPEDVYPSELRPKYRRVQNVLEFAELGSVMRALPQGADQARQHGFSRIMFDEFGFWPEAAATYGATIPTLQGGGLMTIVSTHPRLFAGGDPFYKKLLQDNL